MERTRFVNSLTVDDDFGYGGSLSTDDERPKDQVEGDNEEILLWDSFKCTEPPPKTGSMVVNQWYEVILRIIKFLLYTVLLAVILGGSVLSKWTVLFAVSQIEERYVPYCEYYPGRDPREAARYESSIPESARVSWIWCVILMFSAPEVLNFVRFLWNCFFVDVELPSVHYLAFISVIEILHAFGVALVFLVGLPNLDVVQAAACLSCVCVIPVILGFVSRPRNKALPRMEQLFMYGDIVALVFQIGGLASFTYLAYEKENGVMPWTLIVGLLLSSLRWWQNFVWDNPDKQKKFDRRFVVVKYISKARGMLQAYRPILLGYTAAVRVIAFLLSAMLFASWRGIEPRDFFDGFWMRDFNYSLRTMNQSLAQSAEVVVQATLEGEISGNRWTPLYVLLLQALCCVCVYNCSKFACKTLMHKASFALPLNLATIFTCGSLWLLCRLRAQDECFFHSTWLSIFDLQFFAAPEDAGNYYTNWYAWLWCLWTLSFLWIVRHIWTTENERLATTEKIFATWSYEGLMLDESLAMSRWREEPPDDVFYKKDKEEKKKKRRNVEEPKRIPQPSHVRDEDHVTRIYTCATMWHETPEEMRDFLNSIFRLDRDQCVMRVLQKFYDIKLPDYYELEIHIFFDDALKCIHGCSSRCQHDERDTQANSYVNDFVRAVEKCIQQRNFRPTPPVKLPTPYGGRLLWVLPEQTKMYVHLKDKNRIRNRKRWSQVMYMYYLLGYRLMELPIEVDRKEVRAQNTYILTLDGDIDFRPSAVRILVDRMKVNRDLGSVCGRIHPLGRGPMVWFQKFEYAVGHWLQKSTEHVIGCVLCSPGCFALFRAQALMDYNVMRKYATKPVEARHFIQYDQGEDRWLCTLILQMGYKVEYSAASDAYTHAPESFNEFFIQRRRWIPSTVANIMDLLESADETKKKNRDISWVYIAYQWVLMGSTIIGPGTIFLMLVGAFVSAFGISDWLSFGCNLIPIMAFCLVCYLSTEKTQLFAAGIIAAIYGLVMVVVLVGIMIQIAQDGWLAPSTLLFFLVAGELVITGMLHPLEWTCLLYGFIYYITVPSMYMLLIVFSLFNMNNISWGTRADPKVETGEPQPQQNSSKNSKSKNIEIANQKKEKAPIECSLAGLFKCMLCQQEVPQENESVLKEVSQSLSRIESRLNVVERSVDGVASRASRGDLQRSDLGAGDVNGSNANNTNNNNGSTVPSTTGRASVGFLGVPPYNSDEDDEDDSLASSDADSTADARSVGAMSNDSGQFLVAPGWLLARELGKGEVDHLLSEEERFWKELISRYLDPNDKEEKPVAQIAQEIYELRNEYIFKFFMINALFVLIVFLMQLNKGLLHFQWPLGLKYNITYDNEKNEVHIERQYLQLEPIGCLFILGFVTILGVQFIAMLFHRFETFSHIMAKVKLDLVGCFKKDLSEEASLERTVEKIMKEQQRDAEEDGVEDVDETRHDNEASLPPGRRKTVHANIAESKRKSYATPFSVALERNLEAMQNDPSFAAKRLTHSELRALQARRTTVITERRRQSQVRTTVTPQPSQSPTATGAANGVGEDNIYATANNAVNEQASARRPTGILRSYENRAFDPDEPEPQESDRI